MNRPYYIIPQLIEQPTWGGDYILNLKQWNSKEEFKNKKIGQSYELYGESLLSTSPTLSEPISLSSLIQENPSAVLGEKIYEKYKKMPLLIKLNQARGNSFQLHIKPGQTHPRWKPKPESWYFLENGYISCGIKEGIDIETYKQTCVNIEVKMRELSAEVMSGNKSITLAQQEAENYIKQQNPWQYINLYDTKKFDLIDLSQGGVHHSWEDKKENPLGNIVYEVQLDVMDEFCTIRSFDQGKIKEDGSIREIHIQDYFEFIDTTPEANNINNLKRTRQGNTLLQTPYYSLDILEITTNHQENMQDSFQHLYVQEGKVEVISENGTVELTTGHSCFIPACTKTYTIQSKGKSVVLKTYINNS